MTSNLELGHRPELHGFAEDRVLTDFSAKDLDKVDRDYDWTYWPGGSDLSSASAVILSSGAQIDLGELAVRKVPKYRVRVSVGGDPCMPGDPMDLDIRALSNSWLPPKVGRVPCRDVVVRGLVPGGIPA
jgi:hypothetical protein